MPTILKLGKYGISRLVLCASSLVSSLQIHQNWPNHITYGHNYISNYRRCDKNIILGDWRTIFVPKMLKFGKKWHSATSFALFFVGYRHKIHQNWSNHMTYGLNRSQNYIVDAIKTSFWSIPGRNRAKTDVFIQSRKPRRSVI